VNLLLSFYITVTDHRRLATIGTSLVYTIQTLCGPPCGSGGQLICNKFLQFNLFCNKFFTIDLYFYSYIFVSMTISKQLANTAIERYKIKKFTCSMLRNINNQENHKVYLNQVKCTYMYLI
jgi:hypothetical protein